MIADASSQHNMVDAPESDPWTDWQDEKCWHVGVILELPGNDPTGDGAAVQQLGAMSTCSAQDDAAEAGAAEEMSAKWPEAYRCGKIMCNLLPGGFACFS